MTLIPLGPIVPWQMEFSLECNAPVGRTGNVSLQVTAAAHQLTPDGLPASGGPGLTFFVFGASHTNGEPYNGSPRYSRDYSCNFDYPKGTPPMALASGHVAVTWQGQDLYDDVTGYHHRRGYGPIFVNGAPVDLGAVWDMPLPIVTVDETFAAGSAHILNFGPTIGGVQKNFTFRQAAPASWRTYTTDPRYLDFGGDFVNITASSDGLSSTFTGYQQGHDSTFDVQPYQLPGKSIRENGASPFISEVGGGHISDSDPAYIYGYRPMWSYAVTSLDLNVAASQFGDGTAIAGMPATLGYSCENNTVGAGNIIYVTYPVDFNGGQSAHQAIPTNPTFTDKYGKAKLSFLHDYSGQTSDGPGFLEFFGGYTHFSVFAAEHAVWPNQPDGTYIGYGRYDYHPNDIVTVRGLGWLYDNLLDHRGGSVQVPSPRIIDQGYINQDVRGQIQLRSIPQIAVTRKTAMTIDTGTSPWAGIAIPAGDDDVTLNAQPPAFNAAAGAKWQIASGAGGMTFTYPGKAPAKMEIGIQRTLEPANRRSFRCFRWMRVKLSASASGTGRIALQSKAGDSVGWNITMGAGENVFDLDMAGGAKHPFYGPLIFSGQSAGMIRLTDVTQGVIPSWVHSDVDDVPQVHQPAPSLEVFDQIGEFVIRDYTSPPSQKWLDHEAWYIRIDNLAAGVTYTLEEITVHDRTDGNRTPLRVIAGPESIASVTTTPAGRASYAPFPAQRQALGVLANGRPVASLPDATYAQYFVSQSSDISFQNAAARWMDCFDQGAGCWTTKLLSPTLANLPLSQMGPATNVSASGFTINSRTMTPWMGFLPGFDVTVAPALDVLFEFGSLVDGVVLDASRRNALAGKSVRSQYSRPAGSPPVTERTITTDDDGYFAFPGFRHPYGPDSKPIPIALSETEDAAHTGWSVSSLPSPYGAGAGNEFLFYVLANSAPVGGDEQDIAQDHSHGRIYRIFSDSLTHNLTVHVHEGHDGLHSPPVRAAVVTDSGGALRTGYAPSIWVDSGVGRAAAVYQRGGDRQTVLATSSDGLLTLGAEMALFALPGALPMVLIDGSSGITYVFGAFITGALADIKLIRLDSTQTIMTWADGTTEKVVAAAITAAGRPAALLNRYDQQQSLYLHYGDRRFQSTDGGETWSEITT